MSKFEFVCCYVIFNLFRELITKKSIAFAARKVDRYIQNRQWCVGHKSTYKIRAERARAARHEARAGYAVTFHQPRLDGLPLALRLSKGVGRILAMPRMA